MCSFPSLCMPYISSVASTRVPVLSHSQAATTPLFRGRYLFLVSCLFYPELAFPSLSLALHEASNAPLAVVLCLILKTKKTRS